MYQYICNGNLKKKKKEREEKEMDRKIFEEIIAEKFLNW